ncbi:MAG TPA: hypothetical protein PK890_04005, partial [Terrimesophilobacter sp.]|nr:hypothetical protein [Terrimesophilobacter sp.]
DVVLRDLTIAGPRSGDVLDNALLVVDGGSVDFRNGAVADIRDNPLSGAQRGHAIMIGTSAAHGGASTGSAILENLSLTNYQKTGLIVRAGSVVEVRNSSFDGRGLNCTIATNAIQVQGEATIEGNHIFGHQYASDGVSPCGSDTSSSAAGILVFDPSGPLVIDGNLIEGTQIGIYLSASAATTAPATVSNNTLIGLSSVPMNSWGLQSLWAPDTLAITSNTFTGFVSGIHTNSTGGGETITSNTFTGNNRGVRFSVSPQQFAANSIVGNTSVGVDSTVPVVGGPNWWGCSEGPGNTGCDSLGGSFTEPEWLVLTMSLNQCTVVQGETATATVSLTRTSADVEFTAAFVPPTNSTQSGSSGVAVTPATGATSSGQLPVTITGVQPGSATASATVHNATVSVPGGVGCASLAVLRGALAATGADPLTVALASGLGALALFAGVLCLSAVRRLRRAS